MCAVWLLMCLLAVGASGFTLAGSGGLSGVRHVTLRYLSGGQQPVISQSTPGMPPGGGGLEDGTIAIVGDGLMHLFPTELHNCTAVDGPTCSRYYYWHTRVGHWTAPLDNPLQWTRHEPITPLSDGCTGDDALSHHTQYWSGSPQWSDDENKWFMSYVGYNMQCPGGAAGDGAILLAVSQVEGWLGVGGPYTEISDITHAGGLINRSNAQSWESWAPKGRPWLKYGIHTQGGIGSLSPSYHSARPEDPPTRLWAMYESCGIHDPAANPSPSRPWAIGMVYSDTGVRGPWVRYTHTPLLMFGGFAENPLVMKSAAGLYLLVYATNKYGARPGGFGFGWSKDGVNWEKNTRGLDAGLQDQILSAAPKPYTSVRTPLALVEYSPNRFRLFFTGFVDEHRGVDYTHPTAREHEQFEAMYVTEFELVVHMSDSMLNQHTNTPNRSRLLIVIGGLLVGACFVLSCAIRGMYQTPLDSFESKQEPDSVPLLESESDLYID